MPRALCLRCRRPVSVCYCALLTPIASRTRVVFLQHPRERRVAIGTARMAHLALPNSELHVGVRFDDHPRVGALAAATTAVLFPGPDAVDPAALPAGPPRTLIVVDGTWTQARKLLRQNPTLAALPRIGFVPAQPGRYRIRRAPAAHCLSTVEAVVETLGRLEGDGARFLPVLRAFEHLVATQIHCAAAHAQPYWHAHRRRRAKASSIPPLLLARATDLVLVHAEANAHPRRAGITTPAELVHLVAIRPATGERFVTVAAPRRALGPSTPSHLELPAERLVHGEPVAAAMARWRAFVRPQDLFCAWGQYPLHLLRVEAGPERPLVDLRDLATRRLGRKAGGIEPAARLLAENDAWHAWTDGRAGRRIAALALVLVVLAGDPRATPRERVA